MKSKQKSGWPPPSPRERKPIGYEIKPERDGWIAFLAREGDDQYGRSALVIARGRSEAACRRRAARAVRREKVIFDHENASKSVLVVMYSSGTVGPATLRSAK